MRCGNELPILSYFALTLTDRQSRFRRTEVHGIMLNTVIEVAATMAGTVMLARFVASFLGVKIKEKPWVLTVPTLQFAVQILFDRLMTGFAIVPMIVMLAFAFIYATLLSRESIWKNVAVSVTFIVVMMLTGSFTFSLFSFFVDELDTLIQGANAGGRILYLVACNFIMFAVYKLLLLLFKRDNGIGVANSVMTVVFACETAVALTALMNIMSSVGTDKIGFPV